MGIQGDRLPADAHAVDGVILYPAAVELGLPSTDGPAEGHVLTVDVALGGNVIVYELRPACVDNKDPSARVVYYVAHNKGADRDEMIVGPNLVDRFDEDGFVFASAARNFFAFVDGPTAFDATSNVIGYLATTGQASAALRMLGNTWPMALQDADWWKQPVLADDAGTRLASLRGAGRWASPSPLGKRLI
jgi:hypothetical protein